MDREDKELTTKEVLFFIEEFRRLEKYISEEREKLERVIKNELEEKEEKFTKLTSEIIKRLTKLEQIAREQHEERQGNEMFMKLIQYFTALISLLMSGIALYKTFKG